MEYKFRTITDDDKRELLANQLRAAELDILYHGNNVDMAKASDDDATAEQQADFQAKAIARAEAAGAALDALPVPVDPGAPEPATDVDPAEVAPAPEPIAEPAA